MKTKLETLSKKQVWALWATTFALSFIVSSAFAQEQEKRRPPKEAVDACSSATKGGEVCNFSHDGNNVSGNCQKKDESKPFVCVDPNRPAPGQGGGKPPKK